MEPLVGRWPWPRLIHATVIDYLAAAGAKVIAYDILFAERDIRKFMVGDTEWTGDESDAALVESTRKAGNVVHVAEASSPELDRSVARARRRTRRAGAERALHPGCASPAAHDAAISGAGRGVSAIGHTLFTLDPMARCAASRQSCKSAIARFRRSRGDDDRRGHDAIIAERAVDGAGSARAMIPWRGPPKQRRDIRRSRRIRSTTCFDRSNRSSKARSRASIPRSSRIAS